MNMNTAIIVTSYCGGVDNEKKQYMTKILCEHLSKLNYYVCLASHSPIAIETQTLCNACIYDFDNSFQENGIPSGYVPIHGHSTAELRSIYNGINHLSRMNFKNIFKISYDTVPDIDYHFLIEKCLQTNKKFVGHNWGPVLNTLGTNIFFSEIAFFKKILSFEELNRAGKFSTVGGDIEYILYDSIQEKGLLDQVHIIPDYHDFFGIDIISYSHGGGIRLEHYPF